MTELILNLHKDKQPEVNITIEQKPVAVRFECPYCGEQNRADIDCFVWEELWNYTEGYECEHCGKEVDFNGDIDLN